MKEAQCNNVLFMWLTATVRGHTAHCVRCVIFVCTNLRRKLDRLTLFVLLKFYHQHVYQVFIDSRIKYFCLKFICAMHVVKLSHILKIDPFLIFATQSYRYGCHPELVLIKILIYIISYKNSNLSYSAVNRSS